VWLLEAVFICKHDTWKLIDKFYCNECSEELVTFWIISFSLYNTQVTITHCRSCIYSISVSYMFLLVTHFFAQTIACGWLQLNELKTTPFFTVINWREHCLLMVKQSLSVTKLKIKLTVHFDTKWNWNDYCFKNKTVIDAKIIYPKQTGCKWKLIYLIIVLLFLDPTIATVLCAAAFTLCSAVKLYCMRAMMFGTQSHTHSLTSWHSCLTSAMRQNQKCFLGYSCIFIQSNV